MCEREKEGRGEGRDIEVVRERKGDNIFFLIFSFEIIQKQ